MINNTMPCFYAAIVLTFPQTVPILTVQQVLKKYKSVEMVKQINDVFDVVALQDVVEIVYQEVKDYCSWDTDSVLSALFKNIDALAIKKALLDFGGEALIDISFTHYKKYPSIVIDGHNMEIIRNIGADISIDLY